jgi:hypothetical protein
MHTFKTKPDGFRQIRRTIFFRDLPVILLAFSSVILLSEFGKPENRMRNREGKKAWCGQEGAERLDCGSPLPLWGASVADGSVDCLDVPAAGTKSGSSAALRDRSPRCAGYARRVLANDASRLHTRTAPRSVAPPRGVGAGL